MTTDLEIYWMLKCLLEEFPEANKKYTEDMKQMSIGFAPPTPLIKLLARTKK